MTRLAGPLLGPLPQALVLLLLTGCAATPPAPLGDGSGRVWPPPPAEARIAFVTQFSAPRDLGIERGFLGRLSGFLAGRGDSSMIRPMAIVVTDNEVYFVADPGRRGVHRFDRGKGTYHLVTRAEEAPLPSPVGLALAPNGRVYVADSALGALFVIEPGETVARPLEVELTPEKPTGLAVDPGSGALYVADTAQHRVLVYGPGGELIRQFGSRGSAEGQFNFPTMAWRAPDGRIMVTDSMNFRVGVFDGDGRFLYTIGSHGDGSGDLSRPKGVATDSGEHIYVTDALFHVFQIFDNSGKFLLTVGVNGTAAGEFLLPTGIYIRGDDTVYVCDSQNHRVQVFRYVGN